MRFERHFLQLSFDLTADDRRFGEITFGPEPVLSIPKPDRLQKRYSKVEIRAYGAEEAWHGFEGAVSLQG